MNTSEEDRTLTFSLKMNRVEQARMNEFARQQGYRTMSAVIRERIPEVFQGADVREGRKPGFSPKKKDE